MSATPSRPASVLKQSLHSAEVMADACIVTITIHPSPFKRQLIGLRYKSVCFSQILRLVQPASHAHRI